MQLTEHTDGDVHVLSVVGRFDAESYMEFVERCKTLIQSGMRRLVIDFSELEYISSTGLSALLMIAKNIRQMDGVIGLCSLAERFYQIFEIAGLTKILDVFPSREQAIQSVHSAS